MKFYVAAPLLLHKTRNKVSDKLSSRQKNNREYFVLRRNFTIFVLRYLLIWERGTLTVELLVMGVVASSFFIHGPDPREIA